jgi:hypothetical protein
MPTGSVACRCPPTCIPAALLSYIWVGPTWSYMSELAWTTVTCEWAWPTVTCEWTWPTVLYMSGYDLQLHVRGPDLQLHVSRTDPELHVSEPDLRLHVSGPDLQFYIWADMTYSCMWEGLTYSYMGAGLTYSQVWVGLSYSYMWVGLTYNYMWEGLTFMIYSWSDIWLSPGTSGTDGPIAHSSNRGWANNLWHGKAKELEHSQSQCYFSHHLSHLDGLNCEPVSLDTTHPSTIFYLLLLNWASLRRH